MRSAVSDMSTAVTRASGSSARQRHGYAAAPRSDVENTQAAVAPVPLDDRPDELLGFGTGDQHALLEGKLPAAKAAESGYVLGRAVRPDLESEALQIVAQRTGRVGLDESRP